MKKRKLGIIGGSGLYKMKGFEKTKWKKINTPWGKPSDEFLFFSTLFFQSPPSYKDHFLQLSRVFFFSLFNY